MKIRVGIAEDQALVRESLAVVLNLEPDMEVPWTAANGVDAIHSAVNHPVDVLLMDLRMPELDGVSAIQQIKGQAASTTVLVLTTFHHDEWLIDALRAGASACFLKEVPPKLLSEAIRRIHRERWIPSEWAPDWRLYAPDVQFQTHVKATFSTQRGDSLTHREVELLRYLCAGDTNREIADRLHLSEGTVKNYLSTLYGKMEVRNRTEAVRLARRQGFDA